MTTRNKFAVIGLGGLALGGLALISTISETYRAMALVALGLLILFSVIFLAFAGGNFWAAYLMSKGAEIALKSQESGDRRQTEVIKAQGHAMAKLLPQAYNAGRAQSGPAYSELPPLLMSGDENDFEDGEFTIRGLEQ